MRTFMRAMVCMGIVSLCVSGMALGQMSDSAQTSGPMSMNGGKGKPADKMFLTESAQADMAEIAEGKLALQNSNRQDVRDFGQKMIDDHSSMTAVMKPIADRMGVTPPAMLAPKDQAEVNRLQTLHGADFDRAYLMDAVNDHTAVLAKVKAEHSRTTDEDLRQATANAIIVVETHLKMAKKLLAKSGSM